MVNKSTVMNEKEKKMHHNSVAKPIADEKKDGIYKKFQHKKQQKPPSEFLAFKETVYKKQIPDGDKHMEMKEVVEKKKEVKPKGGAIKYEKKPVLVVGSTPVQDMASHTPLLRVGGNKNKSEPMSPLKRRAEKCKEIMASEGLSLIEASKYIKKNNVKY